MYSVHFCTEYICPTQILSQTQKNNVFMETTMETFPNLTVPCTTCSFVYKAFSSFILGGRAAQNRRFPISGYRETNLAKKCGEKHVQDNTLSLTFVTSLTKADISQNKAGGRGGQCLPLTPGLEAILDGIQTVTGASMPGRHTRPDGAPAAANIPQRIPQGKEVRLDGVSACIPFAYQRHKRRKLHKSRNKQSPQQEKRQAATRP